MFTGIIREVGRILEIYNNGQSAHVTILAPQTVRDAEVGDSICVNGICLTASSFGSDTFNADISGETLNRTTFRHAQSGWEVNIEPSLRPIDRMGGHYVAGHVDGIGTIEAIVPEGEFYRLRFRFPTDLAAYIAEKGSISIDGISLTLASVEHDQGECALVPHTIQNTNLRSRREGEPINIEVDLIARYIQRLMDIGNKSVSSSLTLEKLRQYGY